MLLICEHPDMRILISDRGRVRVPERGFTAKQLREPDDPPEDDEFVIVDDDY